MHTDVDQFEFADFRFVVELDTGAETGSEQLTVWYAESLDVASLPLASFSIQQLLAALQEPERTQVVQEWEQARVVMTQEFNAAREDVRRPFRNQKGRIEQLPGQVQRQLGNLRHQEKEALQNLERRIRSKVLLFERQRFDQRKLAGKQRFGEPRYLRDFYFDETNRRYIENFCRKFASDAAYRDEVLSGRAHWVERNALFVRNLRGQCARSRSELPYLECARAFFKWVCTHAATIIQLLEYQQLQALDNQFLPQRDQLDPEIKEAAELLNRIPGIQTRFSCQGVSGTVSFLGRTLLVVSAHEERGYVTFASLAEREQERMMQLLPGFPAIELRGPPESVHWELRSSGNNLAFRTELADLARQLEENKGTAMQDKI